MTRCSSTHSAARRPSVSLTSSARCRSGAAPGRAAARSRVAPARSWSAVASERLAPAALTGLATGWVASTLPFYPAGWPLGIAALGAALGFAAPRLGLLYALTVAFFPLANISLGLAVVYAAVAACWFALSWRDARAGLLLAIGPLLAPLAALALLPLAAQFAHGRARRAAQAGCALLLAALIAGLRRSSLPFDGSAPPLGLGIAGSGRPGAVAHALWAQLAAHPALIAEALVLGAAAALLPRARRRGPWPAAIFGAALLAATALLAPGGGDPAADRRSLADRHRAGVRAPDINSVVGARPRLSMSVLRNIESKLESLFEGVFGRAFRTNVQPVELARKLVKEMDDHRNISVSRVYVPNEYTIYLSPGDRDQFESYQKQLQDELSDYLAEHARRESYALLSPPRVLFETDEDLDVGVFGIATRLVQTGPKGEVAVERRRRARRCSTSPPPPGCSRPRPPRPSSSASSARSPSSPGTDSGTRSRNSGS